MASGAGRGSAFLLSQLGSLAAASFAELTAEIGLSPSDAGVLRVVARHPGLSQRELADRVGSVPSRVVAIVDRLERLALVSRARSATDRRNHELRLTEEGEARLLRLRELSRRHDGIVLGGLTEPERESLAGLLQRLAEAHGLGPESHPGYRATRGRADGA